MAGTSAIEWTDATWNPIVGCTHVSEGCRHCYAERLSARGLPGFEGLSRWVDWPSGAREPRWTGAVLVREHLMDLPRHWRRPRRIFVNSMSDLFHDAVPDELIDRIFAVMAGESRHTFQILTKRPERMRRYLARWQSCGDRMGWHTPGGSKPTSYGGTAVHIIPSDLFPLSNVWLGVSAENQKSADARRDDLAAVAADGWNTFVSYEPALGLVDWAGWEFLKWFISGGESGPKARPTHPDWHRAAMKFCGKHCIPYLFKQWGEFEIAIDRDRDDPDWRLDYSNKFADKNPHKWLNLAGGCGFHGERFHVMRRVGKRAAGRHLDGMEHNGMPEICHG